LKTPHITRAQLIALVGLTLMWGINWPMMKIAVRELPALYVRGITMGLASLWLMFYFRTRGLRLWPTTPREWRDIVLLALPNIFLWHTLSILGVLALPAGRASILGFMFPVWTVVFGVLFMGQQLNKRIVIAVIAALLGIGLLISHEITALQGKPMGIVWMELGDQLGDRHALDAAYPFHPACAISDGVDDVAQQSGDFALGLSDRDLANMANFSHGLGQFGICGFCELRLCTNHLVWHGAGPAACD
jgi:hypothetical protein